MSYLWNTSLNIPLSFSSMPMSPTSIFVWHVFWMRSCVPLISLNILWVSVVFMPIVFLEFEWPNRCPRSTRHVVSSVLDYCPVPIDRYPWGNVWICCGHHSVWSFERDEGQLGKWTLCRPFPADTVRQSADRWDNSS